MQVESLAGGSGVWPRVPRVSQYRSLVKSRAVFRPSVLRGAGRSGSGCRSGWLFKRMLLLAGSFYFQHEPLTCKRNLISTVRIYLIFQDPNFHNETAAAGLTVHLPGVKLVQDSVT